MIDSATVLFKFPQWVHAVRTQQPRLSDHFERPGRDLTGPMKQSLQPPPALRNNICTAHCSNSARWYLVVRNTNSCSIALSGLGPTGAICGVGWCVGVRVVCLQGWSATSGMRECGAAVACKQIVRQSFDRFGHLVGICLLELVDVVLSLGSWTCD